jgi:hypothetical protein
MEAQIFSGRVGGQNTDRKDVAGQSSIESHRSRFPPNVA